jgi:hypothetical protein
MTNLNVHDLAAVTGGLRVDPKPHSKGFDFKLPPNWFPPPFPPPFPTPLPPWLKDPKLPIPDILNVAGLKLAGGKPA